MTEIAHKLVKNTAIYAVGNFSSKIIAFILVPIISFFLSKEDLGKYDLVQTSLNLFIPLFTFQISNGVYRWLLDKNRDFSKETIIFNGIIISLFGWILFSVFYFICWLVFDGLVSPEISVCLFGGSTLFQFLQYVVRGMGKSKLYSISGVVNSLGLMVFSYIFLKFVFKNVEGLFYAIIVSNLISASFLMWKSDVINFFRLRNFNKKNLTEMIHFSLPLIPNQISWWLISAADKFIILALLSQEMNGIYAISSRFPSIMTLVNSIFILAWQDFTISSDKADVILNTRLFKAYMRVQFCMVLLLIPLSELMVKYLVDYKFYDSYKYMPLLFLGVGYSSLAGYFGAIYLRSKNTKGIFTTSIVGGIINILLSYILMRKIGLYASALGTFLSFFIMVLMRIKQTKVIMPINIPYFELFLFTFVSLVFCVCTVTLNIKINLVLFAITFLISLFINKDVLLKIKKYIIK